MNDEHDGIPLAVDTLRKYSDQSRLVGAVFRWLGYMAGDEDIQVPKDPSFVRKRQKKERVEVGNQESSCRSFVQQQSALTCGRI